MNFPGLSVAPWHHVQKQRGPCDDTGHQTLTFNTVEKKNGGSTVQVKQEHSGVPARGAASWRHQQPHGTASDSETPTASLPLMSPHICSALTCRLCSLRWRVSSGAEILFADVRCCPKGKKALVVTLNECSNVLERRRSKAKPQKVLISLLLRFFTAWGWHHLQSLTDVHRTVSWHTRLVCQLQIIHTAVTLISLKSPLSWTEERNVPTIHLTYMFHACTTAVQ